MKRKKVSGIMLTLLLIGIVTLAFNIQPVKSESRTWTVDDDGPADFSKIQDAINAANLGDTIYVKAGTYHELLVVNKTVSLVGEDKSTTIIDGNMAGIVVTVEANGVKISGFKIQESGFRASLIDLRSNGNKISSNIVTWGFYGVILGYSHNNIFSDNIFSSNIYVGILLAGSNNNVFTRNTIMTNQGEGIGLDRSSNNVMSRNNITDNGVGVSLTSVSDNSISENTITNNGVGIVLMSSSENSIYKNNIVNNLGGISLHFSSDNSIYHNNIADCQNGIILDRSSNNSISGNKITRNKSYLGIWLGYSSGNLLRGNVMADNKYNFVVFGESLSDYVNDVDISNMVDGKPICYLINQRDRDVPPEAGYVALVNCTRIKVKNLNLENNGQGILLAFTTNSTITENNLTNNWYGISLFASSNNSISGNNITNDISGIEIRSSHNNFLLRNNITNTYVHSIELYDSSNNIIYHNNFVKIIQQVSTYNSVNVWDSSPPSGGNFWSDYAGVDLFSGPYQNLTGSDGIGDTPYIIDANNQDRYPLMNPWTPTPSTPAEALEDLIETIEAWNLPKGTENSLTSKLEDALHLLDKGNENGARHKPMDFINQVEALRDKKLTDEQADFLISEAQRIIDLINE